ncbi:MAG: metalloregulator ArsR/SmtB family transcription factor [Hyphomicrobiales bacterium]|nr:metalloregulator ArsR/SmtB family transcription factor [Hyphomicrobiales bacterium]
MPHVSSAQLLTALRAAAEATRLRMLALLSAQELNVKDLTHILGQSQPRVSRHLKLLAEAGLIERYHEGAYAYFRMAGAGPEAEIARALLGLVSADDPVFARDRDRAEAVRRERFEAAQAFFRAHAAEWDRLRGLHAPEAEAEAAMRDALGDGPFDLHVDLGTGTGRVLELFAPYARRGLGVDVNRDMLAYARARLDKPGLGHTQVRLGDIFNLSLADGAADAVTLHQVLHFLDDPARAVAEAARILRPGGRLLIADFLPHGLEILRESYAHQRLGFETAQITEWLRRAGLALIETRELRPDAPTGAEALTLALWLAEKPKGAAARAA